MKKLIYALALLPILGVAQTTTTSPYSNFGYGEPKFNNSTSINAMGGLSTSYESPMGTEANFSNPAANSNLRLTSFEFSFNTDLSKYKTDEVSEKNSASYISGISLAFPVGKRVVAGVGFQPFSGNGYDLKTVSGTTTTTFSGEGGLNSLHFLASYKPLKDKNLSFGVTAQYLFGSTDRKQILEEDGTLLVNEYFLRDEVKGLSVTLGGLYKYNVKKDRFLNIGATYRFGTKLNDDPERSLISYVNYSNGSPNPYTVDTLQLSTAGREFKIPAKLSLSTNYEKDKNWMFGIQYDYEKMSDLSDLDTRSIVSYSDKHRIALGGYWIPDYKSYNSYMRTVTYRAGLYYEKTGIAVAGNDGFEDINDYGITFGMGLPIGRDKFSSLNIAADLGQKGSTNGGLIRETYAKLKISFNLNDLWFLKRKYD